MPGLAMTPTVERVAAVGDSSCLKIQTSYSTRWFAHSPLFLQQQFCKDHDLPCFIEFNYCFGCGKPFPKELAATTHITGCSYCHRSYVE